MAVILIHLLQNLESLLASSTFILIDWHSILLAFFWIGDLFKQWLFHIPYFQGALPLPFPSPALRVLSVYNIDFKIPVDRKTAEKDGANAGYHIFH
jgi:hypothetical protein